jgi:hypothetical protein
VDSSQNSNKTLVMALQKIMDSMKEYRRLVEVQKGQNQKLLNEVAGLKKRGIMRW